MFTLPANVDVAVEDAAVKNVAYTSPFTASGATGDVVPIPTLPFCKIEKSVEPVLDAMRNGFFPPVPMRENCATGDDIPIPMFPFARIEKRVVPVEDATEKGFSDPVPWMENLLLLIDEEVPMEMFDVAMIDDEVEDRPCP